MGMMDRWVISTKANVWNRKCRNICAWVWSKQVSSRTCLWLQRPPPALCLRSAGISPAPDASRLPSLPLHTRTQSAFWSHSLSLISLSLSINLKGDLCIHVHIYVVMILWIMGTQVRNKNFCMCVWGWGDCGKWKVWRRGLVLIYIYFVCPSISLFYSNYRIIINKLIHVDKIPFQLSKLLKLILTGQKCNPYISTTKITIFFSIT